jgi:hypothetical protein
MFVFILISCELAILYTVFWYLYLREPKQARRITGDTWGAYGTKGGAEQVQAFMKVKPEEMMLDLRTNHYVPLPQKQQSLFTTVMRHLDDRMSHLNVRA